LKASQALLFSNWKVVLQGFSSANSDGNFSMTYRVTHCVACNSEDLEFRAAVTAPFVAARVFQQRPAICRIAQCRSCGLIFFEDRFDPQEAATLYAEYRGEGYYQARHHWEPWYTRSFNSELGGAREMSLRRDTYLRTLQEFAPNDAIDTVLDYGGDRGQLITGGPGRRHYVYDISGVEPNPGIIPIADVEEASERAFDLVLLCEVLEHVSEPARFLDKVKGHVRPEGLLYVTVPNREFPLADIPTGAWYPAYLQLLLKNRWVTLAAEFWSTAFRVKFKRIPPLAFVKMHEHVNFFHLRSLTELLRSVGLTILICEPSQDGRGLIALSRRSAQSA
jgi:SAM-dependent methyltransferase